MEVAKMMRPNRYRHPHYFIIGALAMAEAERLIHAEAHNRGR